MTPKLRQPVPDRPFLSRTFAALGQRDFRIYYVGYLLSVTGTWMQSVAQGWLVLILTGSPFMLGVAAAARSLPVLLLSLVGGIAADRFDKRAILVVANGAAMAASIVLAILTLNGSVDITSVLLLTLILGTTNAFEMPARQAFVVELTGPAHLPNAIALNSLMFNVARVVGPGLAGLIVAAFGPGVAFAVNAASFVPVLVSLLIIRPASRVARSRIRGAMAETVAYLRREPRVSLVLLLLAASTILASGHFYLGPALARDLGQGAEGLGLLMSATGVGAILAGLLVAAGTGGGRRRGATLPVAGIVLGTAEIGVGLSGSFALTVLLFGVIGWAMVGYNVRSNTALQTIVPNELRGRVMSLYTFVLLGLMPVGSLLLGAIADVVGAAIAIGLGGTAWMVVVGLTVLTRPAIRGI
ncbi:MAG TPA: MFS transporter [Candidatus Limnocylindrales bacterium]|nr:MFS transporter [Candidatus Limnocylindrales bacterium]